MARVLVAMSGGVDSSVAAALVAEAGHEPVCVTMKLLPAGLSEARCCGSSRETDDARNVCRRLGLKHHVVSFDEVFERSVIAPFVAEYRRSRTPNPCVECNRSVKFGALLELADQWEVEYLATGHYSRIDCVAGAHRLLKGMDENKDQSYFLHTLTQKELSRILFPVGHLLKSEVRERARAWGLPTAGKPQSQDICFIPDGDYREFLIGRRGGRADPGEIRDASGRVVGRHLGLSSYTVGQRRGLDLAVKGTSRAGRMYVTGMDPATNTLTVAEAEEALRSSFIVGRVSWTRGKQPGRTAWVRIRHGGGISRAECESFPGGGLRVDLAESERAIAPGQSAVFYDGDEVLGGGTIEEVL
ncbi:tRNA 2-thiouridine(34) synthase MnmA [Elusimicrobiota bacterium]